MHVLGIDTSASVGTVALMRDGELVVEIIAAVRASHGEALMPLIAQVLERGSLSADQVDLWAVGLGPGSFTGTRIGVMAAKSLAFATNRPIVGVSSLGALALGCAAPGDISIACVDAFKGQLYAGAYRLAEHGPLSLVCDEQTGTPSQVGESLRAQLADIPSIILVGNGVVKYPEIKKELSVFSPRIVKSWHNIPRAACIAWEGQQRFSVLGADPLDALEPNYIRQADAVVPHPDAMLRSVSGKAALQNAFERKEKTPEPQ